MKLPLWFHRLGSPPFVYRLAERLNPWLGAATVASLGIGAYWGLFVAPPDYLQGDAARIIYIHPQTAYVGMMAYVVLAVSAAIGYIWRIKLAHAVAVSAAPIGASFTFCALVTGSIWGAPTWGTFWQWSDPRIMSELLLLFLFLGYMALRAAFDERDKADRVSAILGVVGVVNVPIIHYSVLWWNTLHQGPTFSGTRIAMDTSMLIPFLIMLAGFTALFYWLLLRRLQAEIVDRERGTRWLGSLAREGAK
jgi:heme exporter protein C